MASDRRLRGAAEPRVVHLVDGTYELFRHFYGLQRFTKGEPRPSAPSAGVVRTVLGMIETGATHIGVATDHVIESFRNGLWPGYKTTRGNGSRRCSPSSIPLEEALAAMGVAVWPMVELEADDALASAARLASREKRVERVCIWTPDKDLAQCVQGERVVQVDRRGTENPRRRRGPREVRRRPRADPGLPRAGGRYRRRISRNLGHRPGRRGEAPESSRPHRDVPAGGPRRPPRAGASLQGPGDVEGRRASLSPRGGDRVARSDGCLRCLGGPFGRARIARASAQGFCRFAALRLPRSLFW